MMQVGLLNVDGYYNYLLTFIDKAVDDGFIKPSQRNIIVSAPNAKELVQKLEVGFASVSIVWWFKNGKDNLAFQERIFISIACYGVAFCSFFSYVCCLLANNDGIVLFF